MFQDRKYNNIKIGLIYKTSSPEDNLRLSQALLELISEKDVLNYLNNSKSLKTPYYQQKKKNENSKFPNN